MVVSGPLYIKECSNKIKIVHIPVLLNIFVLFSTSCEKMSINSSSCNLNMFIAHIIFIFLDMQMQCIIQHHIFRRIQPIKHQKIFPFPPFSFVSNCHATFTYKVCTHKRNFHPIPNSTFSLKLLFLQKPNFIFKEYTRI